MMLYYDHGLLEVNKIIQEETEGERERDTSTTMPDTGVTHHQLTC